MSPKASLQIVPPDTSRTDLTEIIITPRGAANNERLTVHINSGTGTSSRATSPTPSQLSFPNTLLTPGGNTSDELLIVRVKSRTPTLIESPQPETLLEIKPPNESKIDFTDIIEKHRQIIIADLLLAQPDRKIPLETECIKITEDSTVDKVTVRYQTLFKKYVGAPRELTFGSRTPTRRTWRNPSIPDYWSADKDLDDEVSG